MVEPVPAAVRRGAAVLAAADLPSSKADARLLLAHALGRTPADVLLAPGVSPDEAAAYARLVDARADGALLQHLTGEAWFRTVRLEVGPGVFTPRPETEVMTGWAIDRLRELVDDGLAPVVVELCAGSGAISAAIAAEVPGCRQYAVEVSPEAFAFASRNLAGTRVQLVEGDMAGAFAELDGHVDLVICNPPYIPLDAFLGVTEEVRRHEPAVALFSGADGLDAMRVVAEVGGRLVRPHGLLCAEHAESQAQSAPAVFVDDGGWRCVRDHADLTGRPRFVTAVRR